MNTAASADVQFFAQQPPEQIHLILSGMAALMQDTEGKAAAMQSQNWFQRMARTVTGKNKLTLEEIRQNHEKLNLYMAEAVAELYRQGCVDHRIMMSLGTQVNEIYADHVQLKQMLGAFVTRLNEKIDSVDNFHMLITEIEQGVYTGGTPLAGMCKVLSQFDHRILEDERKLEIIRRSLIAQNIIREEPVPLAGHLADILDVPMSEAGQVYLELGSIRENFMASILMKMMENYHFLPDMARKTKSRKSLIEKILREEDLDETIALSTREIYDDLVNSKTEVQSGLLPAHLDAYTPDVTAETAEIDAHEEEIDAHEEDAAEKINRLIVDAVSGDAQAQFDLGLCYMTGRGVEVDAVQGFSWFRKAAEQGHPVAQFNLGLCYYYGEGVEQNYIQALSLFRQAAEREDAQALRILGWCYEFGNGVVKDMKQALRYYEQAAELGDAEAQTCLGRCYMFGNGVPKNLRTAIDWLQMASDDGDEQTHFLLAETYYALYIRDELQYGVGDVVMDVVDKIPVVNLFAWGIDGMLRKNDPYKIWSFLRTEEGAEMMRHYEIAAEMGHERAGKKLEMLRQYRVQP